MGEELVLRIELVRLGRFLYERGFIAGTDGNFSARVDGRTILITPRGRCKGELEPADLLVAGLDGPGPEGASIELEMHQRIYLAREAIKVVIHAHPPFLTGLALARVGLDKPFLPESEPIPLIPYYPPGSSELARAVADGVKRHNTLILANHGVVTVGEGLNQARFRLEQAELLAHAFFIALGVGGKNPVLPG